MSNKIKKENKEILKTKLNRIFNIHDAATLKKYKESSNILATQKKKNKE